MNIFSSDLILQGEYKKVTSHPCDFSFQSHHQTIGEDNTKNAAKWGLSRRKQHNFDIFRYI